MIGNFTTEQDAPGNFASQMREANEQVCFSISRYVHETFRCQGWLDYTPEQWVEPLRWFFNDNSDRSPDELEEMASVLSPGGVHTSGLLVDLVRHNILGACPTLLAATVAHNWQGGKIGFQYLPDPASTNLNDYEEAAWELTDLFSEVEPTSILTGDDRDFYDSLPDRFLVYRGCHGITSTQAGAGLCWTTNRPIAEWFARRGGTTAPVLISGWVRKADVHLAFAVEHEIVVSPRRWRTLKITPRTPEWRPIFAWRKPEAKADDGCTHGTASPGQASIGPAYSPPWSTSP